MVLVLAGAVGLVVVSGGSDADPRTPPALPGTAAAVSGHRGGRQRRADRGDRLLRRRGRPAGPRPGRPGADRQPGGSAGRGHRAGRYRDRAAGQRRRRPGAAALACGLGRAALPAGDRRAADGRRGSGGSRVAIALRGAGRDPGLPDARHRRRARDLARGADDPAVGIEAPAAIDATARRIVGGAERADRRWLTRARPLGAGGRPRNSRAAAAAPPLGKADVRALATDPAGADGPAQRRRRRRRPRRLGLRLAPRRRHRRARLRRRRLPGRSAAAARFLAGLDLGAAARFYGDGAPVPGRGPQGDAAGWVAVATRAAGLPAPTRRPWRSRPTSRGRRPTTRTARSRRLPRQLRSPSPHGRNRRTRQGSRRRSGRRAEGWCGRRETPARASTRRRPGRCGRSPGRRSFPRCAAPCFTWPPGRPASGSPRARLAGGTDPWTAPTAWSAWSLAALASRERRPEAARRPPRRPAPARRPAPRRNARPATLPERVDARRGIPRSTTPLAWSHAFAILALRELWPELSGAC